MTTIAADISGGGGAKSKEQTSGEVEEANMFKQLCENVTTAMFTLNNIFQEFLQFKDEILKHPLPSNLVLSLTLMSSRLFRSYSDLCTPVGELNRLVLLHSVPWEMRTEGLKRVRSDYESMQRKFNIALKKLEMMAAEESRIQRIKTLGHWERLFCHVMQAKSHGRRWKFRIEPLRRRLAAGYNPYLSDYDSDTDSEGEKLTEDQAEDVERLDGGHTNTDFIKKGRSPIKHKGATGVEEWDEDSQETTPSPPPPPPPVETADATTSTADPSYDEYLLVQLSRPSGLLKKKDICCTLSLGEKFCTSDVFPRKKKSETAAPDRTHQMFYFPLSEEDVNENESSAKLVIGVYPRNVAEDVAATLSLPLTDIKTTEEPTVLVPPRTRDEEFKVQWDQINDGVTASPIDYALTLRRDQGLEKREDEEDEEDIPLLPMVCHRVRVQRHPKMHSSVVTMPWDELMTELGYRETVEMQSRAASALPLESAPPSPPTPEETGPTEEEVRDEMEKQTQEQLGALSLQHMEQMKQLQLQYEEKLESLSKILARVKMEKSRQIEDLEQALVEMEKTKSSGKKGRSIADIQRMIAKRRKRISHGLPDWGKDLPDDFFERLELFKEESVKKQEELVERIKKEVSEACERQLATQHKLAPGTRTDIDVTTEDISLPALFMPTPTNKHLVYTPRAHKYFHPPGSHDTRVTQPPAIFKLSTRQTGLQTLNLFELSQHFSQTGPQWLKETNRHYSPQLTPAPPPSACGYYNTHPITMTTPHEVIVEEEEEENKLGETSQPQEKSRQELSSGEKRADSRHAYKTVI